MTSWTPNAQRVLVSRPFTTPPLSLDRGTLMFNIKKDDIVVVLTRSLIYTLLIFLVFRRFRVNFSVSYFNLVYYGWDTGDEGLKSVGPFFVNCNPSTDLTLLKYTCKFLIISRLLKMEGSLIVITRNVFTYGCFIIRDLSNVLNDGFINFDVKSIACIRFKLWLDSFIDYS